MTAPAPAPTIIPSVKKPIIAPIKTNVVSCNFIIDFCPFSPKLVPKVFPYSTKLPR